jgi:hypothetical protein
MSDFRQPVVQRFSLQSEHREFDAMPVVVKFHMNDRGITPLLNIPASVGLLDGQPNDMSMCRKFPSVIIGAPPLGCERNRLTCVGARIVRST